MNHSLLPTGLLVVFMPVTATLAASPGSEVAVSSSPPQLEEVVVTAGFRDTDLMESIGSVSIIEAEVIRDRTAQHLEQLLSIAPNVNFASGASRARFVQIRGIGERSQFVDPVDPSVGLVIDDIDISGLGAAATTLDIRQVEVLRGPQGTRYGASALAGMITMRSTDPGEQLEGYVDGLAGNYSTGRIGAALGGPLTQTLGGRLALQQFRSDGYLTNDFLQRDDTNQRDEFTARGKLDWRPGETLQLLLSGFYVDIDNGYDAFSLDNTRHTLSDQPGVDDQQSAAASLKAIWTGSEAMSLELIGSYSTADLEYGFDEDWSYAGICAGQPCEGFEYSSTDNYLRDRNETRLELRALSGSGGDLLGVVSWVAGVYANWRDEELLREFYDFDLGIADARFSSDYRRSSLAGYGQLEIPLAARWAARLGARVERFEADYSDSLGVDSEPGDTLWGGEIAVDYLYRDDTFIYGLVSRGYKLGGVNGEALGRAVKNNFPPPVVAFLDDRLEYASETLINWELGFKGRYFEDRLALRLALFYMDRSDMQVKGWYNEGPLFVSYIDNAASGTNRGAELETHYQLTAAVSLFANVAWLNTGIEDFSVLAGDQLLDKSGRDQAHAPSYQFNLGTDFRLGAGFYGRLEMEGRDRFYFSDSHDEQSDRYQLLHARLGYRWHQLDIALWGRNLTGEDYQTRGFYFGNDPRKFYVDEAYYQYGEPRVYGVEARYSF